MSGSGRKRLSKWDLKDEYPLEADTVQDHGWPGKDPRLGWISPEIASDNGSKWSGVEANDVSKSKQDWGLLSKEPLLGGRVSHKEDYTNKGYKRNIQGTAEWDDDKSYGTRMSPGLDGWRRHSSNPSDRNDRSRSVRGRSRSQSRSRSRSRSRSPHSFKRDSGFHDRNSNRPRLSTKLCIDFTSGRCRRGSSCPFLHQDNQNLDDSWENRNRKVKASRSTPQDYRDYPRSGRSAGQCAEFVKGRCQRGASCRYSHDSAFHELSRGSSNDISRDRENDRNKEVYFSRGERELSSSSIVICKYFAAGNCRNGRNCKFSHHNQARASPERKSSIDKWDRVQYSEDRERLWDGPKSSELASGSDITQLRENNNEQTGTREPRYTWSSEQKWGHGLNNESHANIKALQSNKNETFLCKAEDTGSGIGPSDPRGLGEWTTDMEMSPDWHFTVQPSNHVVKGDGNIMLDSVSQTSMGLATLSHEISQEALAKKKDVSTEPMTGENLYRQNHNLAKGVTIASTFNDKITTDKTFGSHAEGNLSGNFLHGQRLTYHTEHPSGTVMNPKVVDRNFTLKSQDEGASKQGINSGTTITANIVTSEQITQLTNLSVSLAQYFGNVQPLPQLYASLNAPMGALNASRNPHKTTEISSLTYSDAPMGALVASIKSDPVLECPKPHDPFCNNTELKKLEVTKTPSNCSLNPTGQQSVTSGKQVVPIAYLPLSSDPCGKTGISVEESLRESLVTNPDSEAIKEKNGDGDCDCENKTVHGVNENSHENGAAENVDGNDGVHDRKKSKDTKGVRAFKFALAEFVKELLKPTWKEGHVSKDVYKTIVKKVVDKVTGTLQGGHIPQSPEKIDQYLSFSKPKLTKLVQAYVDKVQKT